MTAALRLCLPRQDVRNHRACDIHAETTAPSTTPLATIQPAFTDAERLALAGFLAGYRGLTREAYALNLRQFTTWC